MKFNLLQSQTLIGNTSAKKERGGMTGHYQSSFSTVYRLIDLSILTFCFYLAAFYYGVTITTTGLVVLFINVVAFQLCAEGMDLYRSWRSSHTSELLKSAGITWFISTILTVIFNHQLSI